MNKRVTQFPSAQKGKEYKGVFIAMLHSPTNVLLVQDKGARGALVNQFLSKVSDKFCCQSKRNIKPKGEYEYPRARENKE